MKTNRALLACAFLLANGNSPDPLASEHPASRQEAGKVLHPAVLVLHLGVDKNGAATSAWRDAIRDRHSNEELSEILARPKMLSRDEVRWADLIAGKAALWAAMVDSLRIPFSATPLPDSIFILFGNRGGEDAFTHSDSTICFDLSKLCHLYGDGLAAENRSRIDRFFAHELTHVLHKSWRRKNGLQLDSPFDFALWECLTEGLGNYRSLSHKWVLANGELTPHAQEVLQGLAPIFVDRMAALEHATPEQAPALLAGLSNGAFDHKWGALPVALWLAQDTKTSEYALRKWVEAGPEGVLVLARQYLPEDLKQKMPMARSK